MSPDERGHRSSERAAAHRTRCAVAHSVAQLSDPRHRSRLAAERKANGTVDAVATRTMESTQLSAAVSRFAVLLAVATAACGESPDVEVEEIDDTPEVEADAIVGGGVYETTNSVEDVGGIKETNNAVVPGVHCKPLGWQCGAPTQEGADQCCSKTVLNASPKKYISSVDLPWVKGVTCAQSALGDYRCNTFDWTVAVVEAEGTCGGACGGQASAGCYCDAACVGYGDCCADYHDLCAAEPAAPQAPPPYMSCNGYCGNMAPGGCYCDQACLGYGDCCGDYGDTCE